MVDKPTVFLSRPEGENESLAELLQPLANVRIHPLVKLLALDVTPAMRQFAQDLDQVDSIIFVSKSAVRFTLPLLDSFWPQWPVTPAWFAVGEGTASELADWDVRAAYPPDAGSEGLLALNGLQEVAGSRIVIVRGQGGRALLNDELVRRGADVSYLETYSRELVSEPAFAEAPAGALVVVTSVEILEALIASAGDRLSELRLITASERIAAAARDRGLASVLNAGGASDQAMYDAIVNWQ